MEKNTVLLSVEKYNKLRDFKKETEEARAAGKSYVISESWNEWSNNYGYSKKYFTENEIVDDFDKRNRELADEVKELKSQLNKKDEDCKKKHEPKEITIADVRNMSWREFKKWKRG